MRFIFIQILFFFTLVSAAQNTNYTLKDAETQLPVADVYINFGNGNGTTTNSNGNFEITDKHVTDIEIVHLGYVSQKIKLSETKPTIFLQPETFAMEEVVVNGKRKKQARIFPKRSLNNLMPHNIGTGNRVNFGEMIGVYIPNEDSASAVITKVIVHPTDYRVYNMDDGKHTDMTDARYSPFKINLYTVHPEIGIPLEPLFEKDFTVQLKQDEKEAVLILPLDKQLALPKEGIFIVITACTESYYTEVGATIKTAPSFLRIGVSDKIRFKMYVKNPFQDFWQRDDWSWKNNSVYYAGVEVLK